MFIVYTTVSKLNIGNIIIIVLVNDDNSNHTYYFTSNRYWIIYVLERNIIYWYPITYFMFYYKNYFGLYVIRECEKIGILYFTIIYTYHICIRQMNNNWVCQMLTC